MTFQASAAQKPRSLGGQSRGVTLRDTHWGVVVAETPGRIDIDLLAEASLKFLGLTTMLAAGVQWLYPALLPPAETLVLKSMLTAGFGFVGYAVYQHAHRGFRRELQLDTTKGELRIITRNSRDAATLRQRIAIRDIESCFLRRFGEEGANAQLCMRLRGTDSLLELSVAPERQLSIALDRLVRELRPERRSEATSRGMALATA